MSNNQIKNIILTIVMIGSFLIPFMGTAINVALPSISIEFTLDAIILSWIPTAFILGSAAFILPFGRLADIYGRKRIFKNGILIFTLSSFLAAIATSGILLLLFTFLQGIGCSMMFSTGVALLSSVFPEGKRGGALGLYVASVYTGIFSGLILGGFLVQTLGWRSIFIFNIPFGILLISLIILKLKSDWAGSKGENFDFLGSIIFVFTVIITIIGFSTLSNGDLGKYMLLTGVIGTIVFLKIESTCKSPLLKTSIFKKPIFTISILSILIINLGTSATIFLLSLYLQYIKILSPAFAGVILVLQPLFVALLSPIAGRISDKVNISMIESVGMAITTTGLALFTSLKQDTSLEYIILGLILIGTGLALFSSPATNASINSVGKNVYGTASATVSSMVFIGQLLSMGVVILIFSTNIGNVQIMPPNYPVFLESVRTVFYIFSAVCFAGIIALILMSRIISVNIKNLKN